MKDNKFVNFILKPPTWFIILINFVSIAIIAITISIVIIFSQDELPIYSYPLFALSFILLSYSTFLIVKYMPKIKNSIMGWMKKRKFTKAIIENWGFRSSLAVFISLFFNIAYSIFEGIIAILLKSIWFGALSSYHMCLSIMRFWIVKNNKIDFIAMDNKDIDSSKSWKLHKNCGIVLLILTLALSCAVAQMIVDNKHNDYGQILAIAVAVYTFYKVSISIYNIIRARKHHNPILQTIKNIGFADSLMSLLSLQTALIATFDQGIDMRHMNIFTGSAVILLTLILAINMIVGANKNLKNKENK